MTDALDAFDTQLLNELSADLGGGFPVNANTLAALRTWARYEDNGSLSGKAGSAIARSNPLNTETPAQGSYNAVGKVQGYQSVSTGVAATVATLTNGRYQAIVNALRAGAPLSSWATPSIISEIATWGTHDFADALSGGKTVTALPTTGGSSSSSSSSTAASSPSLTAAGTEAGAKAGVVAATDNTWLWFQEHALPFAVAGVVLLVLFGPKKAQGATS